jgi:methionyl-tRNA formyltransferase
MIVVFMGSPAFALPALQSLMSNQYEIRAVYTQPDKPTGRGRQVMACPVKRFAVSQGMRVIQPESFRDPQEAGLLAALKPDIIIVAAYGQILPAAVLELPRYKCINIHPSLLPRYRGPSPVAAPILNGDPVTGVTIMLIERKVDSGPVLSQEELAISDDDTTESLSQRLAVMGAGKLVETIPRWVEGKIEPRRQDDSRATYTRMEAKEDGLLDWNLPAVVLWRRVRAYHPWPGCYFHWKGGRLSVIKAIALPDAESGEAGRVVALPRTAPARIAVRTADGLLGLVSVQPEGKREMTAADFSAGHRDFAGSAL